MSMTERPLQLIAVFAIVAAFLTLLAVGWGGAGLLVERSKLERSQAQADQARDTLNLELRRLAFSCGYLYGQRGIARKAGLPTVEAAAAPTEACVRVHGEVGGSLE